MFKSPFLGFATVAMTAPIVADLALNLPASSAEAAWNRTDAQASNRLNSPARVFGGLSNVGAETKQLAELPLKWTRSLRRSFDRWRADFHPFSQVESKLDRYLADSQRSVRMQQARRR